MGRRRRLLLAVITGLAFGLAATADDGLASKERLGKLLFTDTNLSVPRGQSCASCHDPLLGCTEPDKKLPVSQGACKGRFGNRNAPTAMYANLVPPFRYDRATGEYVGGLFWDGRAATLEDQAKGPFLNRLEMNNNKTALVHTVARSAYAPLFESVYGKGSLRNVGKAFDQIAEAIAAYERTAELNPFTSRYDSYAAGKAELSAAEKRGLALFEGAARCAKCHPSRPGPDGRPPAFSDFRYDNLGVPRNPSLPFYELPYRFNPAGPGFVDLGLGAALKDPKQNGKFRTPTLRNIATTSPYMHNGVFTTLEQVLDFYNTRDSGKWPPPEVAENINREDLGALGLTQQEQQDIVAFLKTLTDSTVRVPTP